LESVDEVAFVVVMMVVVVVRGNLNSRGGSARNSRCAVVSKKGIGEAWKTATVVLSLPFPDMEALETECTSVEARTTLLRVPHPHRRVLFFVGYGVGRCRMYRGYVISHVAAPRAYFLRRKNLHSAVLFKFPRVGAESTTPRLEKILEDTLDTTVRLIVFVILVVVVVAILVNVLVVRHVFGTE
jgi:hypothetical protein